MYIENEIEHNYNLRIWSVYLHTVPKEISGYDYDKYYVGICSRDNINDRWKNGYGYCRQLFFKAIKKYGWENIKHEVLVSGLTEEEAKNAEIEYIKLYDSMIGHRGYNVSFGGDLFQRGNPQAIVALEDGIGYSNRNILMHYEKVSLNHLSAMLRGLWHVDDKWDRHYFYLNNLWRFSEIMYGLKCSINTRPIIYLKEKTLYPSCSIANKLLGYKSYHAKKKILTLETYTNKLDCNKLKDDDFMFADDYFKIFSRSSPVSYCSKPDINQSDLTV